MPHNMCKISGSRDPGIIANTIALNLSQYISGDQRSGTRALVHIQNTFKDNDFSVLHFMQLTILKVI